MYAYWGKILHIDLAAKKTWAESKPEEWREYYAKDVGLVKYVNNYKEYKGSEPPELVDWRNEVYELVSHNVKLHPKETN